VDSLGQSALALVIFLVLLFLALAALQPAWAVLAA
jgi:hypothetical protein